MTPAPKSLRVVEWSVRDVLGLRGLEVKAGAITVLQGQNRAGKSSTIDALVAGLAPKLRLATLAYRPKPGEEPSEPQVVVILDGADGSRFRVERREDSVRVRERVRDASGNPTAAYRDTDMPPGEFLATIRDAQAANPAAFMLAAPKDRMRMFLDALPIEYRYKALVADMETAAGGHLELPPHQAALHPLKELALIRDSVFRERTGVNRDLKSKEQAAEALLRESPAERAPDHAAELAALESRRADLGAEVVRLRERADAAQATSVNAAGAALRATREKTTADERARVAELEAKHKELAARLRAEVEAKIAKDAEKMRAGVERVRSEARAAEQAGLEQRDAAMAAANEARDQAEASIVAAQDQASAVDAELAALRERQKQADAARIRQADAQRFQAEADQVRGVANRLTRALDALDLHQAKLLRDVPIEGLSFVEGEPLLNGVPLDQLNYEQLAGLAVAIAERRAAKYPLPLIVMEHAEALDEERFAALARRLAKTGCQLVVERHTEDPGLKVVDLPVEEV